MSNGFESPHRFVTRKGRPYATFPRAPDPHWLERAQVVGKAQGRYLWALLIMSTYYAALHTTNPSTPIKIEILGLELAYSFVMASGAVILPFLILAEMGALRAYSETCRNLNQGTALGFEWDKFDISPNAIDLAVYTTKASPRLVVIAIIFSYPIFLTVILAECATMLFEMVCSGFQGMVPYQVAMIVIGSLLWLPAAWIVLLMWRGRILWIPKLWQRKSQ